MGRFGQGISQLMMVALPYLWPKGFLFWGASGICPGPPNGLFLKLGGRTGGESGYFNIDVRRA